MTVMHLFFSSREMQLMNYAWNVSNRLLEKDLLRISLSLLTAEKKIMPKFCWFFSLFVKSHHDRDECKQTVFFFSSAFPMCENFVYLTVNWLDDYWSQLVKNYNANEQVAIIFLSIFSFLPQNSPNQRYNSHSDGRVWRMDEEDEEKKNQHYRCFSKSDVLVMKSN